MDMPEKIAVWRFHPKKADAWIKGGWSECHDHKTTEYTRSDLAVEVKPLVWDINRSREQVGATGLFGEVYVTRFGGKWFHKGECFNDDIDAAKAAAQADYNARILSAITTRPDDLRPKLQALVDKWEGMTCRTKCAQELREVLEGEG